MLPFGTPLIQQSWVVDNLERAVDRWVQIGVGPFYFFPFTFDTALYRGRLEPLEFKLCLAQAGPVQIELIEQISKGPSAYRDVVPEGQTGFHHVCKITEDYTRDVAAVRALGVELATEMDSSGVPSCYADTRHLIGCMLELVPDVPILAHMNALVAEAAIGWDGREPLRDGLAALAEEGI